MAWAPPAARSLFATCARTGVWRTAERPYESGIHQDGVLKHRETYEIMRAEDVGWNANKMVLGKHSGRNAFKTRMKELDLHFQNDEEFNQAFVEFKALADRKHEIFDEDLLALVSQSLTEEPVEHFQLVDLISSTKMGENPTATVELLVDGEKKLAKAVGDGAVDASIKAIEEIAQTGATLQLYSVNAITTGTDAQGEVTVRLEKGGRIVNGTGSDTDIIVASAKAYLKAVNLLNTTNNKAHPQINV